MRRHDSGAGCGARACASHAQVRDAPGHRPPPLRGAALQWAGRGPDERGRKPAGSGRATSPPSGPGSYGPRVQNRRDGAPKRRASFTQKGAHAARRGLSGRRLALHPLGRCVRREKHLSPRRRGSDGDRAPPKPRPAERWLRQVGGGVAEWRRRLRLAGQGEHGELGSPARWPPASSWLPRAQPAQRRAAWRTPFFLGCARAIMRRC